MKSYHWIHDHGNSIFRPGEAASSSFASLEIRPGAFHMHVSRRSVLAPAGAGLASLEIAGAPSSSALADTASVTDKLIAELVRQSVEANSALIVGT
jgi:hypothetical protein